MITIPIATPDHQHDALIIIMDDVELGRLRAADPAQLELRDFPVQLVSPMLLICHEQPTPELTRLLSGRHVPAIVKYLQRGFKFRPELGDHDHGPQSLGGLN